MKKIPFNIKHRSKIESGHYKVVTRTDKSVRIICWDRNGVYPLVGLETYDYGNESRPLLYTVEGKTEDSDNELFIMADDLEECNFKDGDWIVNKDNSDNLYLVTDVTEEFCINKRIGEEEPLANSIEFINHNYRKWSIQDAKEGDVLAYQSDTGELWILILKGSVKDNHINYYSLLSDTSLDSPAKLYINGTAFINCMYLLPATEEQRDTLFNKMIEQQYVWNSETLELKYPFTEFEKAVGMALYPKSLNPTEIEVIRIKSVASLLLSQAEKELNKNKK